jgi:DNA-directed RNA polymerase subunit beta'
MATLEVKDQVSVSDFEAIRLSVASPEDILNWSHGEVLKPETINYRTQKPERDGLFCERIFGPTKDWECYCGKYKKIRYKGVVCDKCGVEVTRSAVRRVRMGHIDLAVPIAHIWYVKGTSSVVSTLFNISGNDIEKVVYFASYVILEINEELKQSSLESLEKEYKEFLAANETPGEQEITKLEVDQVYKETKNELSGLTIGKIISEQTYRELNMKYGQIVKVGIGAEAILELAKKFDIEAAMPLVQEEAKKQTGLNRAKTLKRLRVLQSMKQAGINPGWLILTRLPVIPPDLRPMVQLDGGRFAASDLNDLYRRVINRNNRLKRLLSQGAPEVICRNEKRMLQEAVDALIDNSARKDKIASSTGGKRKLRSLSDMLRGKQGRFRQNLLGKRVDYSGRSVIVVGPKLKLHQCGLPKIMALELFKPFVIGRLISEGYVHNVKNATRLIEKGESFVWDILEDVIKDKHVLLNRAPTLHRLGIQAFRPILIEGKAIQIHPLVCSAFNADFDGDQMAVHLPLSDKAQQEAGEIMLSAKNLLKPASGDPVVAPSQDIILGCHYLTAVYAGDKGEGKVFASENQAVTAYHLDEITLNAEIWVKTHKGERQQTSVGRLIFNEIIPEDFGFINDTLNKKYISRLIDTVYRRYGIDRTAQFVDDLKDLGFEYAQKSALTFAVDDIHIPTTKGGILVTADEAVRLVEKQYNRGLITDEERYSKVIEIWMNAQAQLEKDMMNEFPKDNDIYIIMNSGARGNISQMTQVAAMKGMVADPTGAIIELPIKSNFKEGLSVFEYFVSTHGSRKGRADTALRTSEAGYLTRRLVDVSQDIVITEPDCGTTNTRTLDRSFYAEFGEKWDKYVIGRSLGKDVAGIKAGTLLTADHVETLEKEKIDSIEIFALSGCESKRGVCQKCYGVDLATGHSVEIGCAVGIVAAQAIGEPGTQLTMRTFHTGGAAGEDITQGLPRVEELFEARTPKKPAILAELVGEVAIKKEGDLIKITVSGKGEQIEDFALTAGYKYVVETGTEVIKNQTIAESSKKDDKPIRAEHNGVIKIDGKKAKIAGAGDVSKEYTTSKTTQLLVKNGDKVEKGQALTEGHYDLAQSMRLLGAAKTQNYIIKQVQAIYETQGQDINDKHIEVIIRMMNSKAKILEGNDKKFLPGQVHNKFEVINKNKELAAKGEKLIKMEDMIMGITRVALKTESFLSAASFQETTSTLIDAAISGKVDYLRGLKENVIIGKLIPAGTGFHKEGEALVEEE